jgi:hypothetical protein
MLDIPAAPTIAAKPPRAKPAPPALSTAALAERLAAMPVSAAIQSAEHRLRAADDAVRAARAALEEGKNRLVAAGRMHMPGETVLAGLEGALAVAEDGRRDAQEALRQAREVNSPAALAYASDVGEQARKRALELIAELDGLGAALEAGRRAAMRAGCPEARLNRALRAGSITQTMLKHVVVYLR